MAANGARTGLAERAASTSLEVAEAKAPTLAQTIERQTAEVERALPAHLKASAPAFVRAAITLVKQTPKLAECAPITVLGGLMTASSLGLEFGPLGHCYLVPFKRSWKEGNAWKERMEAQFILGYKGMLDLAWRSGKLKSIEAREVKEHDSFEFAYGLDAVLVHKPTLDERGRTIAYYGVAHFKDGGSYFLVMSRSDIDKHRDHSKSWTQAKDKEKTPWGSDYDAMARKTVIRVMAPFLPLTTEVLREMAQDGVVASGATADTLTAQEVDYIDVEALSDEPTADGEIVDDREPAQAEPQRFADGGHD